MASDATTVAPPAFSGWKHVPTLAALFAALVMRPVAYTILDPEPVIGPLDGSLGRRPWWLFHVWILLCQWIPFGVAWWALARSRRSWSAYGVDWSWFRRCRVPLAVVAAVLAALSVGAPHYWYGGDPPVVSRTFVLLPVSPIERLFFLLSSLSAGICEETCYRGLPLRGAAGSVTQAWIFLPVTSLSFVFVHGWFGWENLATYASVGLGFGMAFILLRRRRLEWLIAAHALVDAASVAAP